MTTLYEKLLKQILGLIQEENLGPGDKLPSERKLSEDLQASRTAIREVLISLETLGYIETNDRGGTYIKKITFEDLISPFYSFLPKDQKLIRDIMDIRLFIETKIASLAAKKMTPQKIDDLQRALDQMECEVAKGETGIIGDRLFHRALAFASDNSSMILLFNMCLKLDVQASEARSIIPGQSHDSLLHNKMTFEAIKRNDSKEASYAMKEHLCNCFRNFFSFYSLPLESRSSFQITSNIRC